MGAAALLRHATGRSMLAGRPWRPHKAAGLCRLWGAPSGCARSR